MVVGFWCVRPNPSRAIASGRFPEIRSPANRNLAVLRSERGRPNLAANRTRPEPTPTSQSVVRLPMDKKTP